MRGLFSRLAAGQRRVDEVTSIIEHLQVLLNARQGALATDARYGVPDFTQLVVRWPDSVRELEEGLRATIERFEPRLTGVMVRHAGESAGARLDFQVQARLASRPDQALRLRTELDAGGQFRVRG